MVNKISEQNWECRQWVDWKSNRKSKINSGKRNNDSGVGKKLCPLIDWLNFNVSWPISQSKQTFTKWHLTFHAQHLLYRSSWESNHTVHQIRVMGKVFHCFSIWRLMCRGKCVIWHVSHILIACVNENIWEVTCCQSKEYLFFFYFDFQTFLN